MLFMVIETFRNQDAKAVYRKFRDEGRMMPEGLAFVSSFVTADLSRCFQLMQCDDVTLAPEMGRAMVGCRGLRDRPGGGRQGHRGGSERGSLASSEWRVASSEWRIAICECELIAFGEAAEPLLRDSPLATRHSPPLATRHSPLAQS